jgi:hypothetical protein
MKHLYQELQQFEADLTSAIEDGELQEELDEMTDNFYFEDVLNVCEAIAECKQVLIDFGYEL